MLGLTLLVVAAVLVLRSDVGAPPVVRGAAAPGFALPFLERSSAPGAGELALGDLAGRVVLINFWATWCEPCKSEMPAMERLYQALRDSDFELVAVAIDEDAAEVAAFDERLGLTFPIVLDLDQSVYTRYQTMGVPESLLVDREGRIVERYVGPRPWDAPEYEARIRALLLPDGTGSGSDGA